MRAAVIQIAPALLCELESRLRGLTTNFSTAVAADFSRSTPVDVAYEALMAKWDKSRRELDQGLTRIAEMVKAIREAFESVDEKLAGGLDGGGRTVRECAR